LENRFRYNHEPFTALLSRYSEQEQRTIDAYFAVIALTRKTRKLADGVIRGELEYWEKLPVDAVLRALRVHIKQHVGKSEKYTRGIMRNVRKEGDAKGAVTRGNYAVPSGSTRGEYGRGGDASRYVGADDPLPI